VFSKYDINGDRALDDAELKQMTSDLENQKVRIIIVIDIIVVVVVVVIHMFKVA